MWEINHAIEFNHFNNLLTRRGKVGKCFRFCIVSLRYDFMLRKKIVGPDTPPLENHCTKRSNY